MYTLLLIVILNGGASPTKIMEVKNLSLQQCMEMQRVQEISNVVGYCEKQPEPAR